MSSIMTSELERLAAVAVGHGQDDPAIDVFLVFVGALDSLPAAATLQPAAKRIGKLRLAQALDRPGEVRLGACRLLAAAIAELPRAEPARLEDDQASGVVGREGPSRTGPTEAEGRELFEGVGIVGRPSGRLAGTVTVERPVETGRRLPELFDALVHAIRVALGLLS